MDTACFATNKFEESGRFPEGFRIKISKNKQNPNKMFIGGLSRDISKQALVEYLSQFGEVLDSVIKTNPHSGLSRGFGFVIFKDYATVEKILQVKEHQLGGKKIEFKRATAIQSPSSTKKIFVGGLSPHMPEEKVREYFGVFGVIEKIELPLCPRTKERRAFGFITYTDANSARKLLETRFHLIGCRLCEVKIAFPKQYLRPQRQLGKDTPSAGLGNPEARDGGFQADPARHGASQNAFGENPNVFFGVAGGNRSRSAMFGSVPFVDPTEGYNFSHQIYRNFQNIYTNQLIFHRYVDYPFGYSYGTYQLRPAFTSYDIQINQAVPFGSGYQGNFQPL